MTSNTPVLEIQDLHISIDNKEITKGVSLQIGAGEVHAIMGPNGSGKSTLANALMGHPRYTITAGRILLRGEDVTADTPDARARKGLFLGLQYPVAIPGVTMVNFLRHALNAVRGQEVPIREFRQLLMSKMAMLKMDEQFARRYINEGFSGGEKKRAEILQMALLQPKIAVLDETDSGLDVDALRTVAEGINDVREGDMGVLLITHYQRMLNYITPDFVHIMVDGRIARSGTRELALEVENNGYDAIIKEFTAVEVG